MKADFYRVLFRKTMRGTYVTISLNDEIRGETLHAAYIGAEAEPVEKDRYPLDILAVGDTRAGTLKLLRSMAAEREIRTVILPDGAGDLDGLTEECRSQGVSDVCVVKDCMNVSRERWELQFRVFSGERGNTLALYQRFVGCNPAEEDCVLTGKVINREPCVPCILGEDDYCGFGCLRNRDFDVLKGHKRTESTCYRMGTLIFSTACMKGHTGELKALAEEYRDELRCICLSDAISGQDFDESFLEAVPTTEDYLYLVGAADSVPEQLTELVGANPCLQYRTVNERFGFCISGYRIPYLKK